MATTTKMSALRTNPAAVRWGMPIAFIRDLIDAHHNQARLPYASHEDGTRVVVEYIEKFCCPTFASDELVPAP